MTEALATRLIWVDDPWAGHDPAARVVRVSSRIRTKRELLGVLRKQLEFPSYFGWNWDALHDCLRDLSWLKSTSHVVLCHDGLPFAPASTNRARYVALLHSLTETPATGTPMVQIVLPRSAAQEWHATTQPGIF